MLSAGKHVSALLSLGAMISQQYHTDELAVHKAHLDLKNSISKQYFTQHNGVCGAYE